MRPSIAAEHGLSPLEVDAIENPICAHNARMTGSDDGAGLAFVLCGADRRIVGAGAGCSLAGTSELKQLWVDPAHRCEDHGRALPDAFVAEPAARCITQIWVKAYNFQAPALCERAGFERMKEFAGYPASHSKIVLRKRLPTISRG